MAPRWTPPAARVEGERLLKANAAQQRVAETIVRAKADAQAIEADDALTLAEKVEKLGRDFDMLLEKIPQIMPGGGGGRRTITKVLNGDFILDNDDLTVEPDKLPTRGNVFENISLKLTGSRTWYVRSDATGAGDGTANTAAGAFADIQTAYTYIQNKFKTNGHTVILECLPNDTLPPFQLASALHGNSRVQIKLPTDAAGPVTFLWETGDAQQVMQILNGAGVFLDGRDWQDADGVDAGIIIDGEGAGDGYQFIPLPGDPTPADPARGASNLVNAMTGGNALIAGVDCRGYRVITPLPNGGTACFRGTQGGRYEVIGAVTFRSPGYSLFFDATHNPEECRHTTGTLHLRQNTTVNEAGYRTDLGNFTVTGADSAWDLHGFTLTGYQFKTSPGGPIQAAAKDIDWFPGSRLGIENGSPLYLGVNTRVLVVRQTINMSSVADGSTIKIGTDYLGQIGFVPGLTQLKAYVAGAAGTAGAAGVSHGTVVTSTNALGLTGGQFVRYNSVGRHNGFYYAGADGSLIVIRYIIDGSTEFILETPSIDLDGTGLTVTIRKVGTLPSENLYLEGVVISRASF